MEKVPTFSPSRLQDALGSRRDEWLAGQLDVSLQTVRNWKNGVNTPNSNMIPRLSAVLDKPLDYFYEQVA